MTPLQLQLTQLIGKKELSLGCKIIYQDKEYVYINETWYMTDLHQWCHSIFWICEEWHSNDDPLDVKRINTGYKYEIIGHPATLSDFHRLLTVKWSYWAQTEYLISDFSSPKKFSIKYDSSKDLLDQDEETLKQIIDLIENNQKHI